MVEGGVCTGADAGSHCSAGRGCCHQQLLLGLQQCFAGWYLQMKARTQSFQLNIRPQEMIDGWCCTDTMSGGSSLSESCFLSRKNKVVSVSAEKTV